MSLTPDQQAVVDAREGAWAVIAGPGAGKTETLKRRVQALLSDGVRASDILCLTFTKEAAEAMLQRTGGKKQSFRTFHSFGYDVVTRELGDQPIEPEKRNRLLAGLSRKWRVDYKELAQYISTMRHKNVSPAAALDNNEWRYGLPRAYGEYETERKKAGWIDFDCQPTGTKVETPKGIIPIEQVKSGDILISWNRRHRTLRQRKVQGVKQQNYNGNLLRIRCGSDESLMTPNHHVWARFTRDARNKYAIYLMWREDLGFRVGQCKFVGGRGYSNCPVRMKHQNAERMWILSITDNYYEALTQEVEISIKYGLPQTIFTPMRNYPSPEAIRRIFAAADKTAGFRCLKEYGKLFERPLISKHEKMRHLTRQRGKSGKCLGGFLKIAAANLIPGIMALPDSQPNMERRLDAVHAEHYSGQIYGLSVEKDHTYIADGLITGNSMICDTRNLLEKPEIRERYQFRYVLADECQDTDSAQFRILQLITEKYRNIMCIGDPAQALYGFRGAEPDNLLKFEKWFPGGRYIYLGRNFRSTATITDFVRENYPIITPLKDKLLSHRTEKGVPIEYKQHTNDWNEAEDALAIANADPENTAILARTNRLLLPLQTLALEYNIRYRLLGRSGFWQQREIQKAIKKLTELGTTPVLWALDTFLGHMMSTYQTDDSTPEDNDAVDNLRSLRKIAEKRGGSARDFAAYGNRCAQVKRRDGVAFGTIHSSKGLEFKTVIIIGAEQGVIPHKKGDNAEERRIWFVGISRAKDRLRLSWTFYPSPFIKLTEAEHQVLAAKAYEKEKIQKQVSLF